MKVISHVYIEMGLVYEIYFTASNMHTKELRSIWYYSIILITKKGK